MGRNRKRKRVQLRKAAKKRAARAETIRRQNLESPWVTPGLSEEEHKSYYGEDLLPFHFWDEQDDLESDFDEFAELAVVPRSRRRTSPPFSSMIRQAKKADALNLLASGASIRETARTVEVSPATVSTWARKEGHNPRQEYLETAENRRRSVLNLYDEGLSNKEISSRLGVSESLVSTRLAEMRPQVFQGRDKTRQKNRALELVKQGYSTREVADSVGVSHQSVANWAKAAGLELAKKKTARSQQPDNPLVRYQPELF